MLRMMQTMRIVMMFWAVVSELLNFLCLFEYALFVRMVKDVKKNSLINDDGMLSNNFSCHHHAPNHLDKILILEKWLKSSFSQKH